MNVSSVNRHTLNLEISYDALDLLEILRLSQINEVKIQEFTTWQQQYNEDFQIM